MAHSEACQLFIEEQIREGLAEGKTPYSIGKELTAMIERLFEASIPANTLRMRADRMAKKELSTNVHTSITSENVLIIPEKQNNQSVKERQQEPGPGRPLKYQSELGAKPPTFSDAMTIAAFVIGHLERIRKDDPKREEAFAKVLRWINGRIKK